MVSLLFLRTQICLNIFPTYSVIAFIHVILSVRICAHILSSSIMSILKLLCVSNKSLNCLSLDILIHKMGIHYTQLLYRKERRWGKKEMNYCV